MAFNPTVLVDAYISINSNVVSDHGNKVTINAQIEDLDATTFGQTWHVRRGGLGDGSIDVSFLNNFSASALDSIFWAMLGTVVPFEIRPTSSAVGAGNPKYTGNIFIAKWTPITGDIGKLVQVDTSFPTSGIVLRATS